MILSRQNTPVLRRHRRTRRRRRGPGRLHRLDGGRPRRGAGRHRHRGGRRRRRRGPAGRRRQVGPGGVAAVLELFDAQDARLPGVGAARRRADRVGGGRASRSAGDRYADATVGIDRFGASAPGDVVMAELGITPEPVAAAARGAPGAGPCPGAAGREGPDARLARWDVSTTCTPPRARARGSTTSSADGSPTARSNGGSTAACGASRPTRRSSRRPSPPARSTPSSSPTWSGGGAGIEDTYWDLVTDDIRAALGLLRPLYDSSAGGDGYVSVEVAPDLARDTAATMDAARALWDRIDRPNLYVKIPGTVEGVPAIRQMLAEGRNINVTLIFSLARYARRDGGLRVRPGGRRRPRAWTCRASRRSPASSSAVSTPRWTVAWRPSAPRRRWRCGAPRR